MRNDGAGLAFNFKRGDLVRSGKPPGRLVKHPKKGCLPGLLETCTTSCTALRGGAGTSATAASGACVMRTGQGGKGLAGRSVDTPAEKLTNEGHTALRGEAGTSATAASGACVIRTGQGGKGSAGRSVDTPAETLPALLAGTPARARWRG